MSDTLNTARPRAPQTQLGNQVLQGATAGQAKPQTAPYVIPGLVEAGTPKTADKQAADQFDYTARYNTQLSPDEEAQYQAWGAQQAAQTGKNPALDTYDYDMRGFWKSGGKFADNGHAGDQFKKPNHPTFSTLSQYHGVDGAEGGTWGGGQNGQAWTFVPGKFNLQVHDLEDLQRYFQQVERGNTLILPGKK